MPLRTPASLSHHWWLLIGLRWLSIAGQLAAIFVADRVLGISLPLRELLAVVCGQLLFNGWSLYRLPRDAEHPIRPETLALAFTSDILALALQLYLTGGAHNPFASLFLVPIAIAGAMLPVGYTAGLVILTLFLYRSLMEGFRPLAEPAVPLPGGLSLHELGMAINFVISAVLIAGFVSLLAYRLRESQRELARARERSLRQEQILGLGTLAAGTAHELGTPLNTIAVLAAELKDTAPDACREDVALLERQVGVCKAILSNLVRQVRGMDLADDEVSPEVFMDSISNKFRILKPEIKVGYSIEMRDGEARIHVGGVLEQAVLNVLNNAADVSPQAVDCRIDVGEGQCRLDILDRGPGFTEQVLAQAGERIVSTKSGQGMGIGLLLSHATLERYGGDLSYHPRPGGGAIARIRLPLCGHPPLSPEGADDD